MNTHRHRYVGLDGLRGVAALAVVLLHQRAWCAPAVEAWLMPRAYLAVDFFLLLSGFVMAHGYGDRLRTGAEIGAFLRARIVRLHPVIVLGAALGALCLPLYHGYADIAPRERVLLGATAMVPLPLPGHSSTIPANFVLWSLSWELLIGAGFALVARHLTTPRLIALAMVGAGLALALSFRSGGLDLGGNPETFWRAGIRLTADFTLGVLMLRVHRAGILASGDARWTIAPILLLTFLPAPGPAVMDALTALALYPLLLLAGAGAAPRLPRLSTFAGNMSYPLYALHGPLVLALHALQGNRSVTLAEVAPTTGALVLIAHAAHRFYDAPLRAWIGRRSRPGAIARPVPAAA